MNNLPRLRRWIERRDYLIDPTIRRGEAGWPLDDHVTCAPIFAPGVSGHSPQIGTFCRIVITLGERPQVIQLVQQPDFTWRTIRSVLWRSNDDLGDTLDQLLYQPERCWSQSTNPLMTGKDADMGVSVIKHLAGNDAAMSVRAAAMTLVMVVRQIAATYGVSPWSVVRLVASLTFAAIGHERGRWPEPERT